MSWRWGFSLHTGEKEEKICDLLFSGFILIQIQDVATICYWKEVIMRKIYIIDIFWKMKYLNSQLNIVSTNFYKFIRNIGRTMHKWPESHAIVQLTELILLILYRYFISFIVFLPCNYTRICNTQAPSMSHENCHCVYSIGLLINAN